MSRYFPRHTREIQAIEPPGFKRLTLSLVEMALITGVVVRLIRAVMLTYAPSGSWLYVGAALAIGAVVLFGMTALHLANYTPRHWLWRAPAFALCEAGGEMVVSAILTVLGREPLGSGYAVMSQWPALAASTIVGRTLAVCIFAALLSVVVQMVRKVAIAHEPDARAADDLRAELFSEAPEPEIDKSQVG